MKNGKEILTPIIDELMKPPLGNRLYPLDGFENIVISEKMNTVYKRSVNPLTLFVLYLMDDILNAPEMHVDGEKLKIQIAEAMREPKEHERKYAEYQKNKGNSDFVANAVINPSVKPSASTTGSAIHGVLYGRTHLRDLLKEGARPDGDLLPDEEKDRIKEDYFERFIDISWAKNLDKKMLETTHAVLTNEGMKDENAVRALANNRILTSIYLAMPCFTPTNDYFYIGQLRLYFYDIKLQFPVITPEEYERDRPPPIFNGSIKKMADYVKNEAIYYDGYILPGSRFDFWSENSKGNDTAMASKGVLFQEVERHIRDRDRAIEKIRDESVK